MRTYFVTGFHVNEKQMLGNIKSRFFIREIRPIRKSVIRNPLIRD